MAFLAKLEQVNVRRGGRLVLHDLDWVLDAGQHTAIFGGNGAGKSSLLRLLIGELRPLPGGTVTWRIDGRETTSPIVPRQRFAMVSPEGQLRYFNDTWQQPVHDAIAAGLFAERFLHQRLSDEQQQRVAETIALLDLERLADRAPETLSQGELRRVMVARAMVSQPAALLLDELGAGLDPAGREQLMLALTRIGQTGTTLVCAAHRAEDLPDCVKHAIRLANGQIVSRTAHLPARPKTTVTHTDGVGDGSPLVELRGTPGYLDGVQILHDLTWTVRAGEHWRVYGPNGCGKSTLLRLLYADIPAAFSPTVTWFGHPRRPPIWELRTRLGFLSERQHSQHDVSRPLHEVVASGLFHTVGLPRDLTSGEQHLVASWLDRLGLSEIQDRRLGLVSFGQARRAMLARAVIGRPALLLLDEALDGLDAESHERMVVILSELASNGTTIVQVTHLDADRLPMIRRRLTLAEGRIVDVGDEPGA